MSDLISRTGAIAHFDKVAEELDEQRGDDSWVGNAFKICLLGVVNDLAVLPSAEPKTGKWLFDKDGYFRCEVCGKKPSDQNTTTDYCPHCGARLVIER